MGKSILILDTPENCYDCDFLCEILYDNIACQVNGEPINDGNLKPDWCPLQEISETGLLYEYQKIGTVEECREARERQREKKRKIIGDDFSYFNCPNCRKRHEGNSDYKYCPNCGQNIGGYKE